MSTVPTPSPDPIKIERLLTPAEVAAFFHVDARTVTRWANSGKLRTHLRTPGGHHRFREDDLRAFMDSQS